MFHRKVIQLLQPIIMVIIIINLHIDRTKIHNMIVRN